MGPPVAGRLDVHSLALAATYGAKSTWSVLFGPQVAECTGEWGGHLSPIRDNERVRFELLAVVLGVWDYIKNSGNHPDSSPWAMDWLGMIPGKRGSRRINGDYILTQHDLADANKEFEDAVAIGGWPMDDHPPGGFDRPDLPPFVQIKTKEVYNVPLRALYS